MGIDLNRQKSGILRIRPDRRTKLKAEKICGIEVVPNYKYLGMQVDDCADLKPCSLDIANKIKKLRSQLNFVWAKRLNGEMRLLAWNTLIRSKVMYAAYLVAGYAPKKIVPLIK